MRRRDFNDKSISSKNFARFLFLVIYLCIRFLLLFLSGQHYICISNDDYFWGIPLLAWVLQTTYTFVQYERIQTKVYTDISIDLFEPRKKEEGDKWIKAIDTILNNSNWRAIFGSCRKFLLE